MLVADFFVILQPIKVLLTQKVKTLWVASLAQSLQRTA